MYLYAFVTSTIELLQLSMIFNADNQKLSFILLKVLHQAGFHRKWSLLLLCLLLIPGIWTTFCLLPKFKIGVQKPEKHTKAKPEKNINGTFDEVCKMSFHFEESIIYVMSPNNRQQKFWHSVVMKIATRQT